MPKDTIGGVPREEATEILVAFAEKVGTSFSRKEAIQVFRDVINGVFDADAREAFVMALHRMPGVEKVGTQYSVPPNWAKLLRHRHWHYLHRMDIETADWLQRVVEADIIDLEMPPKFRAQVERIVEAFERME